jgi:prepilin-type N-terminal cleavage/methylation domain-containing protein
MQAYLAKFSSKKNYFKCREVKLMQKQAGFSLMELMVVLAISAILLSIAIPNFIGRLPAKRLESAASDVNAALQRARLSAIKENTCVAIKFETSSDSYRIWVGNREDNPNNACDETQDADEPTIKIGKMPAGVNISVTPQTTIIFDSRGFPIPNATTTVSLQSSSPPAWTVTLNITGSTRIKRG